MNSMEQSPSWEVNISFVSQDIPRLLWNPRRFNAVLIETANGPFPEPDEANPPPTLLIQDPF
jgi:hypothetical protein